MAKIIIELEFDNKPTNEDVIIYLKELIDNEQLVWHGEE